MSDIIRSSQYRAIQNVTTNQQANNPVLQGQVVKQVILETRKDEQTEQYELRIEKLTQEVEQWKRQCFLSEQQLNKFTTQLQEMASLEARLGALQQEYKSVEIKYREKCNDFEKLRIEYSKLDSALISYSLTHIETKKFEEAIQSKQNIIFDLQRQLQDANERLLQIPKLEDLLRNEQRKNEQLVQEIDQWKQKYTAIQQDKDNYIKQLKYESEDINQKNKEFLDAEIHKGNNDLLNKVKLLQAQIEQLKQEGKEFQNLLQLEQSENNKLRSQVDLLNARIVEQNEQLNIEIGLVKERDFKLNDAEAKIKQLEDDLLEIRRLDQIIQDLETKNQNLVNEIDTLRNEANQYKLVIQQLEHDLGKLMELENKVAMLSSEIERLKQMIASKNEQIDRLKQQIDQLNKAIDDYKTIEAEKQVLENKCAMLATEIERKKFQIEQRDVKINELNKQINEQQQFIDELKERPDLSIPLAEAENLIKLWQEKYQNLEQIQNKYTIIEQENYQLKNQLQALLQELDQVKKDLQQRSNQLNEAESTIHLMEQDLNKLNSLQEQIKAWESKYQLQTEQFTSIREQLIQSQETIKKSDRDDILNELRELQGRYQSLETQNQDLIDQLEQLRQLYIKCQAELEEAIKLESKVYDLENKVAMLSSEVERLKYRTNSKDEELKKLQAQSKDFDSLKNDFQQMNGDLQNTQHSLEELTQQLEEQLDKFKQQTKELNEAQQMRDQLENKIAMLSTEIERYKYKLNNKQNETDQLKKQILDLQQQISQLSQVENDNIKLNQECEKLDQKYNDQVEILQQTKNERNELQQIKSQLEQELSLIQSELQSSQQNQEIKNKQIKQLENVIQDKEQNILQLKNQEQKMFEYETKLAFLSQEIERQTNQYKVKLGELAELQSQLVNINELQIIIQTLESEKTKLSGIIQQKEHETQLWKNKVDEQQKAMEKFEEMKYQMENKIAMLSSEVERLNYKYKVLLDDKSKWNKRMKLLFDELTKVSMQNEISSNEAFNWKHKILELAELQSKLTQQDGSIQQCLQETEHMRQQLKEQDFLDARQKIRSI
ncbi:unnamed protein product [Paramecium pentaurelia]|uniref:Uncharacterized protein n=1 Tax=Paramecium pentaurelia TaxID=43138 RepID=A0A8S1YBE7_9CILI|nr:unnamed protein product [Paramecium pentaurelia]